MCIYVYMCVYVCICVYMCVYVCICVYVLPGHAAGRGRCLAPCTLRRFAKVRLSPSDGRPLTRSPA